MRRIEVARSTVVVGPDERVTTLVYIEQYLSSWNPEYHTLRSTLRVAVFGIGQEPPAEISQHYGLAGLKAITDQILKHWEEWHYL